MNFIKDGQPLSFDFMSNSRLYIIQARIPDSSQAVVSVPFLFRTTIESLLSFINHRIVLLYFAVVNT